VRGRAKGSGNGSDIDGDIYVPVGFLILAVASSPPELRASEFVSDLLLFLDESLVDGDVCSDALQLH
jgi:hypothetical protein